MDPSQVYNPSGISTRGANPDFEPNSSAPSSSGDLNDLENNDGSPLDSLVTRPNSRTTSRYEMLPPGGPASNYVPITSFLDKFSSNSQATSLSLSQRVNRLIRSERKMMKQKQNLIKDISSWSNVLPNDDCKKLLYHFIKILESELHSSEQFVKKKEQINVQLSNVDKREKRTNELKMKRNKMLVKLRDHENKVGDSPITTLTKENLEELECSVEIVEEQFIRSINNGLKNSIVDYVLTLQDTSVRFKENSEYFLENYYFSSTKLNQGSNLQRLILRNKFNQTSNAAVPSSAATDGSKLASFSNTKYVPLFPNQTGKCLDNTYDNHLQEQQAPSQKSARLEEKSDNDQTHPLKFSSTTLLISNQDINSSLQPGKQSHPPPTTNSNRFHEQSSQPSREDETNFIINAYTTPGSLAIRPSTQLGNQHEWNT